LRKRLGPHFDFITHCFAGFVGGLVPLLWYWANDRGQVRRAEGVQHGTESESRRRLHHAGSAAFSPQRNFLGNVVRQRLRVSACLKLPAQLKHPV
jgi:hypothetical protein